MKKALKEHAIPILTFIGIGIFVFLPILWSINNKILGDTNSANVLQDGYQFIWSFWWAKKTCLSFCGDFWNTNYQFFPIGSSLLFHAFSYINLATMLPFMFLGLSSVGAYNLSLIIAIFLSSFGAYLLVYHLTKNRLASLISGLIFGISPFLIGHLLDGQHDYATIQFLPFWLLFLLKSDESKKLIYPILAGILLFIMSLEAFTYLVFAFLIWIIWLIYKLLSNRRIYKELFRKALISFIVFLIPFIVFSYKSIKEIKAFDLNSPTKWNSEHFSSDLLAFITPTNNSLLGKQFFENKYQDFQGIYSDKSVYLGISILVLSGLGIWSQRKKWKKILFWLSLGSLAFILSLGPKLHINGEVVFQWMPFQLLEKIPILNLLRAPSRFSVIMFLSLAVLSGYGSFFILQRLKNDRLKIILFIIIAFLVIFEYFPFYKQVRTLSVPKGYEKIKEDKEDFAILEIPLMWMSGLKSEGIISHNFLYYQTFHEKKVASGYITRVKNDTFKSLKDNPLLNFVIKEENKLLSPNQEALEVLEKYTLSADPKKILANNKFKYLVLQKKQYLDLNNKIKNVLKDYLDLYFEDEELEIYAFKNYEKN